MRIRSSEYWIPSLELRNPAVLEKMSFEDYVKMLCTMTPRLHSVGLYLKYSSRVAEVEAERRGISIASLVESINLLDL